MEIKKHKTWKKTVVEDFAKARKVFLYKGERRILDFLSFIDVATIEDIARATLLSKNILKAKYLRELETIGFIKRTTQDKITLYFLQKWGMYKIAEEREGLDDLQKKKLKEIAKKTGLFSQTKAFAQPEHQILNAKVGAEFFRAYLIAEKQEGGCIFKLLNKRGAKRFIDFFFESRGRVAKGVPIPDFMLEGNEEVIFIEVETRENKKDRLREKLCHYDFLKEEIEKQYRMRVLFIVDSEKDKVRWVRKTLKAQQATKDSHSFTVGFSRKLVDTAELKEWLENWHVLEGQEDRFGFISLDGDIFNLKTLEETYQISAMELAVKRMEEAEEKERRKVELQRILEERKKQKEQEEERRKEAEELKEKEKAELEKERNKFLEKYTTNDWDMDIGVNDWEARIFHLREELEKYKITRDMLREGEKVELFFEYSEIHVTLHSEDFTNKKIEEQCEKNYQKRWKKDEEYVDIHPKPGWELLRFMSGLQWKLQVEIREGIIEIARREKIKDRNKVEVEFYYFADR